MSRETIERLVSEVARLTAENERLRKAAGQTALTQLDLESVVSSLPCLLFLLDEENRLVDFRQGAGARPFLPPDRFIGRSPTDVLPAETGRHLAEACDRARQSQSETIVEYSLVADGVPASYEARVVPLEQGRLAALVFEVTDRVAQEEALKMRLEQQSAVARLGLAALRDDDLSSLMQSAVRSAALTLDVEYCKILELPEGGQDLVLRAGVGWKEGLVGVTRVGGGTDSQAGYTLLTDRPVFVEDLATDPRFRGPPLLVEHGVVSGLSVVIRGPDRPWGVLGVHSRRRRTFTREDGNFLQAVANVVAQAVERERIETRLREREERFRALIERSSDIVLVVDQHGIVQFVSPAVEAVLGYTVRELVGRNGFDVVEPSTRPAMREELAAALAHPGQHRRVEGVRLRHKNGSERLLEAAVCSLLHVPSVRGIVVNLRDVTSHARLEQQLDQARRLESVGRLAGGIAHDFNNILTAILGHAEMLAQGSAPAGRHPELDSIRGSVKRAQDLVQRLLAFARKQVLQPQLTDLNAVIRETDHLLRRLVPENVIIRTYLEDALGPVMADPSQLEQVLVNLAVNARDAMPEGGRLTIETANVELSADWVRDHAGSIQPGPHVMLAVSDTGLGMTGDVLAHVFEPFFSTKGPGEGAGLGLATVYGIVMQSGGHIYPYSEPGMGSTFKIYLPRAEGRAEAGRPAEAESPPSGAETILLVEDDVAVLGVTRRILEGAGYTVLSAPGPRQALALESAFQGPIHLVVTDVVMAEMSGKAMATELEARRPEVAVLYISGYTENSIVHHGVVEPGTHFLPKPFGRAALLAKVREILDRPASG